MTALRERRVRVLAGDLRGTVPDLRRMYRADGLRTMCYVPIVFRDEVLGLLVLYHRTEYAWSTDETDLARAFGDHIAVAMQNVRLAEATHAQTDRLRAISELAIRLNRIQDIDGIAAAIVSEAGRPDRARHDPRLPGRPRRPGRASRSPSRARSSARTDPDPASLRVAIGEGLTGWVAAPTTGSSGSATPAADAAASSWATTEGPESMLARADGLRGRRPRRHRRLQAGPRPVRRRRRDDVLDLRELRRPGPGQRRQPRPACGKHQAELQHQLSSQRRLLEVNERLLSNLEPASDPRPHRGLAQGHRPVRLADRLPRRPRGRRPSRGHRPRPVRRPDPRPREPARRRASPAGSSTTARPCCPTTPTSILARSRSRGRPRSPSR